MGLTLAKNNTQFKIMFLYMKNIHIHVDLLVEQAIRSSTPQVINKHSVLRRNLIRSGIVMSEDSRPSADDQTKQHDTCLLYTSRCV